MQANNEVIRFLTFYTAELLHHQIESEWEY